MRRRLASSEQLQCHGSTAFTVRAGVLMFSERRMHSIVRRLRRKMRKRLCGCRGAHRNIDDVTLELPSEYTRALTELRSRSCYSLLHRLTSTMFLDRWWRKVPCYLSCCRNCGYCIPLWCPCGHRYRAPTVREHFHAGAVSSEGASALKAGQGAQMIQPIELCLTRV